MEKMVLIPLSVIEGLYRTSDDLEIRSIRIMLEQAIDAAPAAVIPISKIPESCFDCPCKDDMNNCEITGNDADYNARPDRCPIITKE